MQTNREFYDTAAFGDWSTYTDLEPHEIYLLKTFLDPACSTVDAGTGGGRIVLGLRHLGFQSLHAFDYVPQFVHEVRSREAAGRIRLSAQDATRLAYRDQCFDQIVYLAQILCLVGGKEARGRAFREAYRILRPGGTALFSFLSHEVRSGSLKYRTFLVYLRILRMLIFARRDMQTLPWLRIGGRFNRKSLLDKGPYVYWYRAAEAVADLRQAGFRIKAVASLAQLQSGHTYATVEELAGRRMTGHFYCVCEK